MTTIEQDLTHISFHEATLTSITLTGSTVSLVLEDVHIADVQRAAEVTIEGVNFVLRDGLPIVDLRMEKEDGEVLTLRKEVGQVLFLVEWNDFAAKSQETVFYTFNGSMLTLKVTSSA